MLEGSGIAPIRVAALVVTYNRPEDLRQCVAALMAQTLPPTMILVLDNAGPVPAKEILNPSETLKILRLPINLGGAGGFSAGLAEILKQDHEAIDWIWLLDDDAIPEPQALSRLIESLESQDSDNPPAVLLSAVEEFGQIAVRHRRSFDDRSGMEWPIPERCYQEKRVRVDTGSFVGFLIRRDVARKIPLPRADFFLAFDDTDYSLRIRAEGQDLFLIPESRIRHLRAQGSRLREGPFAAKHYLNVRNHLFIKRCHAKWPWLSVSIAFFYGILLWLLSGSLWAPSSILWLIRAFQDGFQGRLGPPPSHLGKGSLRPEGEGLCILLRTQGRRPELLREAVASALLQQPLFKVMVLVHGDSRTYQAVDDDLSSLKHPRLELIQIEAQADSRAHPLNVALQSLYQGTGPHPLAIAFLDDDDILYPDFSNRLLSELESSGADLVYAATNQLEPLGLVEPGYAPLPSPCLLIENFMPINSYVVRFRSLQRTGVLFGKTFEVLEDWNFLQRLLGLGFRFVSLPGVYAEFRLTGDGNRPDKTDQALWDRSWMEMAKELEWIAMGLDGFSLLDAMRRFDFGERPPLSDHERDLVRKTLRLLQDRYPTEACRSEFKALAGRFS